MLAGISINSGVPMSTERWKRDLRNFSKILRLYKCKNCRMDLPWTCYKKMPKGDMTEKCKACYDTKRGRKYCVKCRKPSPGINKNLHCHSCNASMGLRQCIKCKRVLVKLTSFDLNEDSGYTQTSCKDCAKASKD